MFRFIVILAFVSWHWASNSPFWVFLLYALWASQAFSLGILWVPDDKDSKVRKYLLFSPNKKTWNCQGEHLMMYKGQIEKPNKHTLYLGQKEFYQLAWKTQMRDWSLGVLSPTHMHSCARWPQYPVREEGLMVKAEKISLKTAHETDLKPIFLSMDMQLFRRKGRI